MNAWRNLAVGAGLGLAFVGSSAVFAQEQYIPIIAYRTGPVTAIGSGAPGGFIDYMDMLNKRDGGVNGIKLVWEDCETGFQPDRGIECYERLKRKGTGAPVLNPMMTALVYALIDRAPNEKIPIVTPTYGRADTADGRVFPWVFPLMATYWSANTAKIQFIAQKEGGIEKLKGKKIANVYVGVPYGKETLPLLDAQAKKYGFELTNIEVSHPGTEQQAQWLRVRQLKPDWVILRGAGVMAVTALKMAQKVGYPADRIVGTHIAGAEEDVVPAGEAAKGYIAVVETPSGTDFPVIKDIARHLYAGGKRGNLEDPKRLGSIYYNLGVAMGIVNIEALRVAHARFGRRPITGEEMRWALEHLNLDTKRLRELGAEGLVQPLKTSCADHEGGHAVKFHQWDGSKWVLVSDWISSDKSIVRSLVEESAMKYAKEKGITPRDCSKES